MYVYIYIDVQYVYGRAAAPPRAVQVSRLEVDWTLLMDNISGHAGPSRAVLPGA